jgi:hypothetical protein
MKNILDKFIKLRQSLANEKAALEARLKQIEEALAGNAPAEAPAHRPARRAKVKRHKRRKKNPMSLRKAIIHVTTGNPMTKEDILAAIENLGYRFASKNPINSLNSVLYARKQFKNEDGKFSPA